MIFNFMVKEDDSTQARVGSEYSEIERFDHRQVVTNLVGFNCNSKTRSFFSQRNIVTGQEEAKDKYC